MVRRHDDTGLYVTLSNPQTTAAQGRDQRSVLALTVSNDLRTWRRQACFTALTPCLPGTAGRVLPQLHDHTMQPTAMTPCIYARARSSRRAAAGANRVLWRAAWRSCWTMTRASRTLTASDTLASTTWCVCMAFPCTKQPQMSKAWYVPLATI